MLEEFVSRNPDLNVGVENVLWDTITALWCFIEITFKFRAEGIK